MKISRTYEGFHTLLERVHPKYNKTLPLPFENETEEPGG